MDKQVYVLTKLPAVTEAKAALLIKAGLTNIKLVRAASNAVLKAAGAFSDGEVTAIKGFVRKKT